MRGTIIRLYPYLFTGLIGAIIVLSYLIGVEDGRIKTSDTVVFACSDEVLGNLKIPLADIAKATDDGAIDSGSVPNTPKVLSETTISLDTPALPGGKYLGSKNGTKYYTPECPGAKRIKPENYVWFDSEQEAKIQGYSAAKC